MHTPSVLILCTFLATLPACDLLPIFVFGNVYQGFGKVALSLRMTLSSSIYFEPRLPIIQLYKNNVLLCEFFMGNDLERESQKFKAFMSTFDKTFMDRVLTLEDAPSPKFLSYPFENVYDERTISMYTALDRIVVLKLYRHDCKRCQQVEPMLRDIVTADQYSHIRFLQGNVDDLPHFKDAMRKRLSGKDEGIDVSKSYSCDVCGNTGFVLCTTCEGSGIVQRGENFLTCSKCTGKKKVKCVKCGNGGCIDCY